MQYVILKFERNDANRVTNFLRKRYGLDKYVKLRSLCKIAIRSEVAAQAKERLGGERVIAQTYEWASIVNSLACIVLDGATSNDRDYAQDMIDMAVPYLDKKEVT